MGNQVFVSQDEPEIRVKYAQALEEIEAFSVQPPSSVVISSAGQIVDHCVNVGANGQVEEPNVVSDVTDIGESHRVANVTGAASESGSSRTTAYCANHDRPDIICCHIAGQATWRIHTVYASGKYLHVLEP
jgi:hypothetical protein